MQLSLWLLRTYVGNWVGRRVGFSTNQMRKKEVKEMKEKDSKREKENLNIFFSNIHKDY
jgi:hypothetical protein